MDHKHRPKTVRILATSAGCALLTIALQLLFPASVKRIHNIQYDHLLRTRPSQPAVDDRLVLFGVDDRTVETIGRYPVPRSYHAQLTRSLAEAGATLAAWDMIFDLPGEADGDFAAAMKEIPTVMAVGTTELREGVAADADWLGGASGKRRKLITARILERFGISRLSAGRHEGLPAYNIKLVMNQDLLEGAAAVGHASPVIDPDGVCRRVPLAIETDGHLIPSISLAVVMQMLGLGPHDLRFTDRFSLQIGGDSLEHPISIPMDSNGRMLVNYAPRWQDAFDQRSYAMQLKALADFPADMKEGLAGRAVLIGETQSAGGDFVPTPLQSSTPGMVVLASAVNTILTGQFIGTAAPSLCMLLAFAAAIMTAIPFTSRRPGFFLFALVPFILLPAISTLLLFQRGYFLPVALPLAAVILTAVVLISMRLFTEHRRAARTAQLLSKFVSPSILHELESKDYRDKELSVSRKELSVLFVDLVGFTQRTGLSEPEEMAAFLAAFYDVVLTAIHEHGGTLDKVQGDGAIAYFGAPEPLAHKERCAVKAALQIAEKAADLNKALAGEGHAPIAIRCGIATDFVALGYFGGEKFATYTIIGRAVNLAARLEQNAEPGQLLVDRHTAARIGEGFTTEPLDAISLKGIDKPVDVLSVSASAPQ